MEQQLSRQAAVLAAALCARGGTLQSRLRERSTGVGQDLPADVPMLSGRTAVARVSDTFLSLDLK